MLKLKIVSPQKIEFEGDVQSVLVPGVLGQFEILTNHAPIISALTEGTVVYAKSDGVKSQLAVAGGFEQRQGAHLSSKGFPIHRHSTGPEQSSLR